MKAELNLTFSYALLYRTDMTDKLREENIGVKKKHIYVSFQSVPVVELVLTAFTETSCSRLGRALTSPRAWL